MQRRTLLTLVGGGAVSFPGCTTGTDLPATDETTDEKTDDSPDENDELPEECPKSQEIDVEWPVELDASAAESFVEAYEHAYYRDLVVEYEAESRLDSYGLSGVVGTPPTEMGDGWEIEYSGNGGIYRPTLSLDAATADPPEGADQVSVGKIDDVAVTETLEEAADAGEAEFHVDTPGDEVDRYLDLFTSLSDDFEELSGHGDSDRLYVDVDGTTVELSVTATNFHGDYGWNALYYVDEQVVRRTTDRDADPRNGQLLECRTID